MKIRNTLNPKPQTLGKAQAPWDSPLRSPLLVDRRAGLPETWGIPFGGLVVNARAIWVKQDVGFGA